ncbi:hypothetical protein SAZ11_08225 [Streptomyces sp. FXJ1.4098]|nr:hypothetical protein [Streptomyces sp. FXJ1.4098]
MNRPPFPTCPVDLSGDDRPRADLHRLRAPRPRPARPAPAPCDVTVKDERAVTPETIRWHAARLGLDDADVIFLGGQDYADLLLGSVPHLHAPLAGGMGDQRGQCARARDEADVREAWWKKAAALHNEHAARRPPWGAAGLQSTTVRFESVGTS